MCEMEVLAPVLNYFGLILSYFGLIDKMSITSHNPSTFRDRRGINNDGQLPSPRRMVTDLFIPGYNDQPRAGFIFRAGTLLKRFSFGKPKRFSHVDLTVRDGRVGSFNGEVVWRLQPKDHTSWVEVRKVIDALIAVPIHTENPGGGIQDRKHDGHCAADGAD
ncbi:hypothetical protein BGZ61DRAFT_590026 [Ilyonectria robusta]|uniref:uncharacterized protein n=1 Tax=Ilyonectria robusta TaxID=1079257 RepID=UPI001E8D4E05|nr:uncharacterized protein BGZ61DRAFT_590026 [Ilyonectria robusta]KAH8683865.1 hypothetical protein BGZ61DRAFT_590026 [Ilyonectria robusta]